jgi:hypothetical protein
MVRTATALWDDTVAAVISCFARAFGLEAKFVEERRRGPSSRTIVKDHRQGQSLRFPLT